MKKPKKPKGAMTTRLSDNVGIGHSAYDERMPGSRGRGAKLKQSEKTKMKGRY